MMPATDRSPLRRRRSIPSIRGAGRFGRAGNAKTRRGAAAVEFAVIAPIFILLVLGMIELGRGVMVQQILTNASRVGARRAVVMSATQQEAIDAAEEYAASAGVNGVTATVTPDPATADPGDEITVAVSVNFGDVTWIPAPWFMGGAVLNASSVMRKEGF